MDVLRAAHSCWGTSRCCGLPRCCPLTPDVYRTQLLGCLTLFWFAMVLKTIIARAVSSHFHKEAHFAKMKQALEKVRSWKLSWSATEFNQHH